MRSAQYVITLTCCASWASCLGGCFDAFAAVQESLLLHKLHAPQTLGLHVQDKPITRSDIASPWVNIGRAIGKTLQEQGQGIVPKQASTRNSMLSISYAFLGSELGTNASLIGTNCSVAPDQTTGQCKIDLKDGKASAAVAVDLGAPLHSDDFQDFEMHVNVLFIHTAISVTCPICGSECKYDLMGQTMRYALPSCPIPAGTWILEMPARLLREQGLTNLPFNGSILVRTKVLRASGAVAVEYGTVTSF